VPLALSDLRLPTGRGFATVMGDLPFLHLHVQATALVFAPRPGLALEGRVIKVRASVPACARASVSVGWDGMGWDGMGSCAAICRYWCVPVRVSAFKPTASMLGPLLPPTHQSNQPTTNQPH
jgi:hypothetical protein